MKKQSFFLSDSIPKEHKKILRIRRHSVRWKYVTLKYLDY